MRKMKIVADSSANLLSLPCVDFASVPLKIITAQREFIDDAQMDAGQMMEFFASYKGSSKTSCPSTGDWINAFEDGEDIFCVTITGTLSGSYNAACAAAKIYESEHPGRRVCVIDSLSTGPEMVLLIEKIAQLMADGLRYEEICREIKAYQSRTGLLFMMESLRNFAANGRVSPALAKLIGILGIRIVGKASDKGDLQPLNKCRGENRSLEAIISHLKEEGLKKGKVHISHCNSESVAQKLKNRLLEEFPQVQLAISACRGLCCYYAEKGGLLVGFEKF